MRLFEGRRGGVPPCSMFGGSGDVRDAGVAEDDEVLDRRADAGAVVDRTRPGTAIRRRAARGSRRARPSSASRAMRSSFGAQVGEEDTVDPSVAGEPRDRSPPPRAPAWHDASTSAWPDLGELALDPGMKAGKNGSAAITSGLAGDDEAEGERPVDAQGAGPHARAPAELLGDARGCGSRVSASTPGRSLRAKETSPLLTPARRATSAMVGRPLFDAFAGIAPSSGLHRADHAPFRPSRTGN